MLRTAKAIWDYTAFGGQGTAPQPDGTFRLTFENILGGRGGYNRWTINGKSWPDTNPLLKVERGKRYRLVMTNNSGDTPPRPPAPAYLRGDQDRREVDYGADKGHAEHGSIHDG